MAASETRSALTQQEQSTVPCTSNQPSTAHSQPLNYSNAVKSNSTYNFPKKEQAIIMNAVEGLKIGQYVVAIGNIVGPKKILFASRISNGRMCIYLDNKQTVETLVNNHNTVLIENNEITIRRFVTPARRLILSNVNPCIPHQVLENQLKHMGFKTASPISFLRASVPGDEYGHVLSFRRQIYVLPDDNIKMPTSIVTEYDESTYRVFLTYDELLCFTCKLPGHLASKCPNQTNTDMSTQNTLDDLLENNSDMRGNKRAAPSSSTSLDLPTPISPIENETLPHEERFIEPKCRPKKSKKLKTSSSTESLTPIDDLVLPAKEMIENASSPYVLSYEQLCSFLENAHGNRDPLSLSQTYTDNTTDLLKMLDQVYPQLTQRSIKNRITRIIKKIRYLLLKTTSHSQLSDQALDDSEYESEASQVSY